LKRQTEFSDESFLSWRQSSIADSAADRELAVRNGFECARFFARLNLKPPSRGTWPRILFGSVPWESRANFRLASPSLNSPSFRGCWFSPSGASYWHRESAVKPHV